MKTTAICVDDSDFNFITVGKEYVVEKETRDFIYIKNDSGILKRYGRKRFEKVEAVVEKPKEVIKEKPKRLKAKCIIPKQGLNFGGLYDYKDDPNDNTKIIITNTNGEETHLKKRFEFE